MNTVGILYHPKKETAGTLTEKLSQLIESRGFYTWKSSAWEVEESKKKVNDTDLLFHE